MTAGRRRAVFLDRDGVINRESDAFIKSPAELHVLPGAPAAIRRLNEAGLAVAVITNQSGIPRGLLTEVMLERIHAALREELAGAGAHLDAIRHCPHLPGAGCACRKPAPGMLLDAAAELGVDAAEGFMVGDRQDDIAAGKAAGCETVLVLTGRTAEYRPGAFSPTPDAVVTDLAAAVEWILGRLA